MTDGPPPLILRPVYQNNQVLKVDDFVREQTLHVASRQLQTGVLFRPGILTGFTVTPGPSPAGTGAVASVTVSPGAALDDQGRLILLVDRAEFEGAAVSAVGGQFTLPLHAPRPVSPGEQVSVQLVVGFREEPVPGAANQARPAPVFSLVVPQRQEPPESVMLAEVTLTAAGAAGQPGTPGDMPLAVTVDPAVGWTATLSPGRLPPIDASQITSGVLDPARVPATQPDDGPIPAERIVGPLGPEQIPALSEILNRLTAVDDFVREQPAHVASSQLQTRVFCTDGVLTGLTVAPGPSPVVVGAVPSVTVSPGAALDDQGRLIQLVEHAQFEGGPITAVDGQFTLPLPAHLAHLTPGETDGRLIVIGFGEEPVPGAADQARPEPVFSLVVPQRQELPESTVVLAMVGVTAAEAAEGSEASLTVSVNTTVGGMAKVRPDRLPPIDASQITSGVLNPARVPAPQPQPDVGPIPAQRIVGPLGPDQIPALTEILSRLAALEQAAPTPPPVPPTPTFRGLYFNGTNASVDLGTPSKMEKFPALTVMAWIRPEASDGIRNIVAHGYTDRPRAEIYFRLNDGRYQIGCWAPDSFAEAPIPVGDLGRWVHLAGSYDGATWRLHRNGIQIASTAMPVGPPDVPAPWSIGARGPATERFFQGHMFAVSLWRAALDPTEIRRCMVGLPTEQPNLVAFWPLDPTIPVPPEPVLLPPPFEPPGIVQGVKPAVMKLNFRPPEQGFKPALVPVPAEPRIPANAMVADLGPGRPAPGTLRGAEWRTVEPPPTVVPQYVVRTRWRRLAGVSAATALNAARGDGCAQGAFPAVATLVAAGYNLPEAVAAAGTTTPGELPGDLARVLTDPRALAVSLNRAGVSGGEALPILAGCCATTPPASQLSASSAAGYLPGDSWMWPWRSTSTWTQPPCSNSSAPLERESHRESG
ncbi:LamG domain-containing protein [Micromonospora sp. NPDC048999]|uniref:LamG domain-containing protein n=1 Tax=Micromonospora sp. NPDC048999 TaxID=3155391 RepID=UPI0033D8BF65